eukprot:767575-Hanusia_phi.AAC.6
MEGGNDLMSLTCTRAINRRPGRSTGGRDSLLRAGPGRRVVTTVTVSTMEGCEREERRGEERRGEERRGEERRGEERRGEERRGEERRGEERSG